MGRLQADGFRFCDFARESSPSLGYLPFDPAIVPDLIRDRWQGRSKPEGSARQQSQALASRVPGGSGSSPGRRKYASMGMQAAFPQG